MADHGGDSEPAGPIRRSRLSDYAEMAGPDVRQVRDVRGATPPPTTASTSPSPSPSPEAQDIARRRREFAALLGEFRRAAVLVPLDENEVPLTGDQGGVRWIYAFSNDSALARFAIARGEGSRVWAYRRVLGARLLDAAVVAVGVPCGVALDVGSGDDGVLFPPVAGIVPDSAAVYAHGAAATTNREEPR
ncbi:hypothetical protein [Streptomyces hygroscopicus]|uniref:hypothetical protein n=1 Tax=Streptomyces hygroscopicus TaxID=1912 RepID=UPI00223FF027|nr:hypothetical protein [Streptomyces hygroscopicus]